MQGERAHAESGQFYRVQKGHLGHAVGLRASAGPVLVTLNLGEKGRYALHIIFYRMVSPPIGSPHTRKKETVQQFLNHICLYRGVLVRQALLWIKPPRSADRSTGDASL